MGKQTLLSPTSVIPFDRALVDPRVTSIFCIVGGGGTLTLSTHRRLVTLKKNPWGWMPNHATCDFSMFSKSRISPMVVHFLPHDATEGKWTSRRCLYRARSRDVSVRLIEAKSF